MDFQLRDNLPDAPNDIHRGVMQAIVTARTRAREASQVLSSYLPMFLEGHHKKELQYCRDMLDTIEHDLLRVYEALYAD